MKSATAASIWRGHALAVLVSECVVGAVMMEWARNLFLWAGTDAWLSVILAGIVSLVLGGTVTYAVALHPEAQPGTVLVTALGPWLGGLLSLGFVLYTLAEAARVGRTAVELLHFAVLPRTPDWVLMAPALLIAGVLLRGGIESVLHYQFTLFWPTVLLTVAVVGLGFRFADWANFLPVLGQGAAPVIQGVGDMIEPALGLELGLVYLPYFLHRGVSTPGALRAVWGGTVAAFSLYLYVAVALLVGLGPFESADLTWPVMEAVRRTYLTGLFFERLDVLFLISLLIAASFALNLYIHAGLETLRRTCSLRPRAWQVWACVLGVWGIALIPTNLVQADWWRRQVLQPLGLVYLVPVPLLLVSTGLVRRYRGRFHA